MPRLHDPDMSFNLVNNAPGVVLCSAGDTLPGQFGPLAGGKWYFKMGRSTNITSGIRNRALVYVNWAAEEHIDDFGRVCGLVHGSAVSLCSRGFCSSMEDTRQWVKEKIPGVSVSLPVPPGWA
ncbi:hypothetical protein BDW74DRAFT_180795 [Aspergillus multicolor]|uniref:uncharacterized protein n=1 Tax=Aspergillus multicolor TaxID=41759 RepID=UPI003CCE1512